MPDEKKQQNKYEYDEPDKFHPTAGQVEIGEIYHDHYIGDHVKQQCRKTKKNGIHTRSEKVSCFGSDKDKIKQVRKALVFSKPVVAETR